MALIVMAFDLLKVVNPTTLILTNMVAADSLFVMVSHIQFRTVVIAE